VTAEAVIIGAAEVPYARRTEKTTPELLAEAAHLAAAEAGIALGDVDGFGVASFTLAPDHAIDLAWRLGLRLRWLMDDANGGASALNLLQHARRAVEGGDAATVLLVAGDALGSESFRRLADAYNSATRDHLTPLPFGGPNALFALLTRRHMTAHRLGREDYGVIVLAQRAWAQRNPDAVYRTPLTMQDYLDAPVVADPLTQLDCVPIVSGADAVVVTTNARGGPCVAIRGFAASYNPDGQEGDGLTTGLAKLAPSLWAEAGAGPENVHVASLYDDYPVMVVVQLTDLGFAPGLDAKRLLRAISDGDLPPFNTSGGQLSAGQAGAAGGMHGLVEVVRQLLGQADARQVEAARIGLVSGYGMVLYHYGACANAAVLERVG
jgi:acetyl-CoA acetyltransferase